MALMVLQVSLIGDYPKLVHKELLPFTTTELQGSGVLTYCNLGQSKEADLLFF